MFKHSRYIHVQTPDGVKRGFTLHLEEVVTHGPNKEGIYTDILNYTQAICSQGDAFSRKAGRDECLRPGKLCLSCRVVDLPKELAKLEAKCYGYKLVDAHDEREASNRWAWVWKYFL